MPAVEVDMFVTNKKATKYLHGMWALVFLSCIDIWAEPNSKDYIENETNNQSDVGLAKEPIDSPAKTAEKTSSALPTIPELLKAKEEFIRQQQEELNINLGRVNIDLSNILNLEKNFDNKAYVSLSMINTAPVKEYRLDYSKVYLDGVLVAQGGKRNAGLPRAKEIFFGNLKPGCHEVRIEAKYTRLTNTLIDRFKTSRIQRINKTKSFFVKDGYIVYLTIEGFEKQNTFLDWYRGPDIRFNASKKENFLPGSALPSMDSVLNQGRIKISYAIEDQSNHHLIEKSISIDGLPILQQEKHDDKNGSIIFDAPLREGKHRLNVVLLFAEKKWIKGGANYNFRLNFDREFYVEQGFTTLINLLGMPKNGVDRNPSNNKYARVTSKIIKENDEFFPEGSCEEISANKAIKPIPKKEDMPKEQSPIDTKINDNQSLEKSKPEVVEPKELPENNSPESLSPSKATVEEKK